MSCRLGWKGGRYGESHWGPSSKACGARQLAAPCHCGPSSRSPAPSVRHWSSSRGGAASAFGWAGRREAKSAASAESRWGTRPEVESMSAPGSPAGSSASGACDAARSSAESDEASPQGVGERDGERAGAAAAGESGPSSATPRGEAAAGEAEGKARPSGLARPPASAAVEVAEEEVAPTSGRGGRPVTEAGRRADPTVAPCVVARGVVARWVAVALRLPVGVARRAVAGEVARRVAASRGLVRGVPCRGAAARAPSAAAAPLLPPPPRSPRPDSAAAVRLGFIRSAAPPPPRSVRPRVADRVNEQVSRLTSAKLWTPTIHRAATPAPGSATLSVLAAANSVGCGGLAAQQSGTVSVWICASAWKLSNAQQCARTMSSSASRSTTGHCPDEAMSTGSPPSLDNRSVSDWLLASFVGVGTSRWK